MPIDAINTRGQLHRWLAEGRDIHRETVEGVFTLFGFKIVACPQFDLAETAREMITKSLLRQKVFLDSLCSMLARQFDSAVEFRAIKRNGSKVIDLLLFFRVFTPGEPGQERLPRPLESVRDVLHSDYEYEALRESELPALLNLKENAEVVNVRKRLTWLPVGDISSPRGIDRVPPLLDSQDLISEFKEGTGAAYAAPGVEYLGWNDNNWLTLWRIMQESEDDLALRLSLSSVNVFPYERAYANQVMLLILRTYGGYAKYDYDAYVKSMSKFARPASLYSMQVQVAGASDALQGGFPGGREGITSLNSVAHALCGEVSFGGVSRLDCFPVQGKEIHAARIDWQLCRHTYPDDLSEFEEVQCHKYARSFMLRAPFIVDEIEAATLFRLPIAGIEGLPGIYTRPPKPFYQPNLPAPANDQQPRRLVEDVASVGIQLGRIIINHQPRDYHRISPDDLTRHALIVGSTGSGKTNSTLNLLLQLAERGIPFLVVEPVKGEYGELLAKRKMIPGVFRYHAGDPWLGDRCNPEFLRFNPLEVPRGISIAQHISFVKNCICAAFPMYGIAPLVLEIGLRRAYEQVFPNLFHISQGTEDNWPSLVGLRASLKNYINREFTHAESRKEWDDMFQRRFDNLLNGVLGYVFTPAKWKSANGKSQIFTAVPAASGKPEYRLPLDVIMNERAIIDLEALADDDEKALVIAFLLTLLYEKRIAEGAASRVKHVMVIEEAHRLLSSMNLTGHSNSENASQSEDSKTKAIRLFMDMLAEVRAYGESIVIVEQIPTKLISDAIKNTNLKVMHRITSQDDRQYLGEAMNFDEQQKRFVANLKRGEAVVFEERLDHPVLVKVDPRKP